MLTVLYEDNHLLVLNKPAGLPSTHFDGHTPTLDRLAKDYLKQKYNKPGNVFLGVVHRLDKPVSGVIAFARTSKAASRLSEQFRDHTARKTYWAITTGRPVESRGTWEDFLVHDDSAARVVVVNAANSEAKLARLKFEVLASDNRLTLWKLEPETGRKHQLRVQLASRGFPILGDAKYGSARSFDGIALHARRLSLIHPTHRQPMTWTAEVPPSWAAYRSWCHDD